MVQELARQPLTLETELEAGEKTQEHSCSITLISFWMRVQVREVLSSTLEVETTLRW